MHQPLDDDYGGFLEEEGEISVLEPTVDTQTIDSTNDRHTNGRHTNGRQYKR